MSASQSVRHRLLFRGRPRRGDGDVAQRGFEVDRGARRAGGAPALWRGHGDVAQGAFEFDRVELRAGVAPVLWSELEVSVARPVGDHLDALAEVKLGVELVELARGDEGEEVAGGGGVVVGTVKHPGLP